MSLPTSSLWKVQHIENAGRGVIASRAIAQGTVVHDSGPPSVHVVFKQYSKETCAQCFLWDRGRALPVRDADIGKAFCSTLCRQSWIQQHGDIGVEAWRVLTAFMRSGKGNGKIKSDGGGVDALMKGDGDSDGDGDKSRRPCAVDIRAAWQSAAAEAKMLLRSRTTAAKGDMTKQERQAVQAILHNTRQTRDYEKLSYFLCGLLFDHAATAEARAGLLSLAMDDTPYNTHQELEDSCMAFLQLTSIMPLSLVPHLTADLCLNLVRADNHNAFGIRGGGEDSEEYMGYGVYPSASYFNHSCDANIHKKRTGRSWTFHAAQDIQPGDELCITYLGGDEKDLDLPARRGRLEEVWGFVCHCARCKKEFAS